MNRKEENEKMDKLDKLFDIGFLIALVAFTIHSISISTPIAVIILMDLVLAGIFVGRSKPRWPTDE